MKNLIITLSLFFFQHSQAIILDSIFTHHLASENNTLSTSDLLDCDACGCAAGNGSSGFESILNQNYIGLKYFAQHYLAKENMFTNDLTQHQYFNTVQIWSKVPITKKLSIYGSLPYHFHEKQMKNGATKVNGIGDISILGLYEITKSDIGNHLFHTGIGIKIPTGKFDEKGISGVNPSFQLGTGSWDYQIAASYKYQQNRIAIMVNTDYTMKAQNSKHYKFGNQWNYALIGFYNLFKNENNTLLAKIGWQGEVYDANKQYNEVIAKTSGSAIYNKLGIETSYKKWSLGTELMLPMYSNLASQDIKAKSRFSLFINLGL